ncbi:MAG: hypothetical protein ACYSUP_19720 [Planctomycetota bacterium]|jgi:hypothetical protein
MTFGISVITIAMTTAAALHAGEMPGEKTFSNSVGMKFVRIEPGGYRG